MSAPCVIIKLALEEPPVVLKDCASEDDKRRLEDWLDAHPEYWELIYRARDLMQEAKAA